MQKLKMFGMLVLMIAICFGLAFYSEYQNVSATSLPVVVKENKTTQETNTNEDTTTTIMLDAGHGGYDSGGLASDGTNEKEITLNITLLVGDYLTEAGYNVAYTRIDDNVSWESDNLSDLQARVAMAQVAGSDYYISIHTNFSAYSDGAYGYETYLDYENDTIVAMAENIHSELNTLQYSTDRGLKDTQESSLYVIDKNPIPAMLLELGFLSDIDDAFYLMNYQDVIAQAIAQGIMDTI